jgi:hypothetical protein
MPSPSLKYSKFPSDIYYLKDVDGHNNRRSTAMGRDRCNLHKADRISVTSSVNGDVIPLFNPRLDDWSNHFEWDDYTLVSKSEIGRVTIQALDLNHDRRIRIGF